MTADLRAAMPAEDLKARLRGVFTILVTPFRDDLSLNVEAIARNADHVLERGAQGFIVGGTYGEFPSLTFDERCRLITEVVRVTRGRVPVVACTAHSSTLEALELTRHAAQTGADGVMLTPPYVTEVTDDDILYHFEYIARRVEIGIVIYNTVSTGVLLSSGLIDRLAGIPGIVGMKQGATSQPEILQSMELARDRLAIMCASDTMMLSGLALGMHGVTSTNSGFMPGLIVATYEAFRHGDMAQAQALFDRWAPFRAFARRVGQPAAAKAALDEAGLNGGPVRPPLRSPGVQVRAELAQVLTTQGLL